MQQQYKRLFPLKALDLSVPHPLVQWPGLHGNSPTGMRGGLSLDCREGDPESGFVFCVSSRTSSAVFMQVLSATQTCEVLSKYFNPSLRVNCKKIKISGLRHAGGPKSWAPSEVDCCGLNNRQGENLNTQGPERDNEGEVTSGRRQQVKESSGNQTKATCSDTRGETLANKNYMDVQYDTSLAKNLYRFTFSTHSSAFFVSTSQLIALSLCPRPKAVLR